MARDDARRRTLGVYGPGGSDRSGVSRYIEASIPHLRAAFDVTVVPNTAMKVDPWTFDVTLYHLGNNAMHHRAFEAARIRPGVAMMHEYLHLDYYYQSWRLLGASQRAEILCRLGSAIGTVVESLADVFDACARRGIDQYALDIGIERYVIEGALACVFHSASVAERMQLRYPAARCEVVPFPITALAGNPAGCTHPHAFTFGVFGFIGAYKRVDDVLAAWGTWDNRPSVARLLLVGERQVGLAYQDSTVAELGYVSDDEFIRLMSEVDCGIQLRGPSLGETSAPAAWLVAHGRPVILSDIAEMRDLGQHDRVLYVSSGQARVSELVNAMRQQYERGRKPSLQYDERFSWSLWRDRMTTCLATCCG